MNTLLIARIADRPGALERLLGTIRRCALPVERVSFAKRDDDSIEVALRHRDDDGDRTRRELSRLFDVLELTLVSSEDAEGARELAVARVSNRAAMPDTDFRVLDQTASGTVIELTGTPHELDEALTRLKEQGALDGSVRTGELLPLTAARKAEPSP